MLKWICTVWYFCTTRHFNLFSKDLWHSVISQQFYNIKRCFAERKAKTSRLWILDTGLITERDLFLVSVMKHDLKQLIYTFCWTKDGKGQKYFEDFRLLSNVDDILKLKLQILQRIFEVIEQREKIFWIMDGVKCWSNYADYVDWATWFLWSLRDSWFSHMFSIIWLRPFLLCSVPSYMPSFGEKD